MSSEIDDAVAALGPFLQSAESLLQEVPHPHIIPTSLPHPGPSPQPLSLQLSSMGTVAELQHEVALLTAPGSSAVGAFEAVSRIACGHPEGGGLQVPSLNWYEDSDVSAFMHRNGSRHSTETPDNDSSERGRGVREPQVPLWGWGQCKASALPPARSLLPGAAPQPGGCPTLTALLAWHQTPVHGQDPVHTSQSRHRPRHG